MVKSRAYQGKLDGVEFLHGNPNLTLHRMTPEAMRLLEDLGLIPFLQGLNETFDMPLVLQAKRSYNNENNSITIPTPQGEIQEILLSSDVMHFALRLPAVGTIRPTTQQTKQMCVPYFTNLIGQNKDGYPLANIVDTNIRLVAEAISSHVEISRAERKNYIHARMFCPIHLFLHQQELVHWASLGFDELKKGLKSTRDFVAYGPHLTQIITWCLTNPGIHLGHRTRPEIPRSPLPPSPRIEELELNFEPTSADVNISDFIEDNIQFADTEHSAADIGPSGTAYPADIEGSSQREISEAILRREVEERERKEREERERGEMREEQEAKAKTDEDVRMRSRTPSPQQGSNEDEEDWSFLEATITKIKRGIAM